MAAAQMLFKFPVTLRANFIITTLLCFCFVILIFVCKCYTVFCERD